MTITLGLLYSAPSSGFSDELRELVNNRGYFGVSDLELLDDGCRPGLRNCIQEGSIFKDFLAIYDSIARPSDLSVGIDEELERSIYDADFEPKFFELVLQLDELFCRCNVNRYMFFFCGEWEEGELPRFSSGTLREFIMFLRRPCGWREARISTTTWDVGANVDSPLLFEISN